MQRAARFVSLVIVWLAGSSCLALADYEDHRCDEVSCWTYPSGEAACVVGECVCNDRTTSYCSGRCVDFATDSGNCGSCSRSCGVGFDCKEGECKQIYW